MASTYPIKFKLFATVKIGMYFPVTKTKYFLRTYF